MTSEPLQTVDRKSEIEVCNRTPYSLLRGSNALKSGKSIALNQSLKHSNSDLECLF